MSQVTKASYTIFWGVTVILVLLIALNMTSLLQQLSNNALYGQAINAGMTASVVATMNEVPVAIAGYNAAGIASLNGQQLGNYIPAQPQQYQQYQPGNQTGSPPASGDGWGEWAWTLIKIAGGLFAVFLILSVAKR